MKKLYILFAFLSIGIGFSQTILNQNETISRTVQDPLEVRMAPGFIADAVIVSPFKAKIGSSTNGDSNNPTDSDAGSGNPSGTIGSNSFHDTQGNIDVNGGGQLQFTLPVALPPGVRSVAPQINLIYISGTGNGIAGYGWSLSGITAISKMGKTVEKDGVLSGIQMNSSDNYSFNGLKLILAPDSPAGYGLDGATYITERYSNVRIKSKGMAYWYTQPLFIPASFEVTYEDGSQAIYGVSSIDNARYSQSMTPLDYNIAEWKDPQGNYITYRYSLDNPNYTTVISSIKWGGNKVSGQQHFNEIVFDYSTRDLKEQSYVKGTPFLQNRILNTITVNNNGNLFKKYEISYKKQGTNYQFVDTITEKNSQDEPANPIVFEYNTNDLVNNVLYQDSRYDDLFDVSSYNLIKGDFNSDGKPDFLKYHTLMLGRLEGNSTFLNVGYQGYALGTANQIDANNRLVPKQLLVTYEEDRINKKLNLFFYALGTSNLNLVKTHSIDLANYPSLFDSKNIYTDLYCYNRENSIKAAFREGDFNGDGNSDFIIKLNNLQRETCKIPSPPRDVDRNTIVDSKTFYIDIKNNIQNLINNEDLTALSIVDSNGDTKSEILKVEGSNIVVYELNNQNQFTQAYSTPKESLDNIFYFGDFNGDGKTDILAPIAQDSSDWRMYISTGIGFKKEYYSNLFLYQPSWQGAPRKNRNIQRTYSSSDLNKDGKSDLVIFESQVWYRDCLTCVNNPDSSYGFNYLRNEGVDSNGKPIFSNVYNIAPKELDWDGEDINYSMYGEHYIPLFGDFRVAQLNTDFAIIHRNKLITWDLGSKLNKISKIKSITQGGLKTDIEYAPLTATNDIYKSYYDSNPVEYPYANIIDNINYDVVSKVIQGSRKQDFRYRDMIGHMQGGGILGFRQSARSTFYADGFESTKIWSGSEMNPLNEALPLKEWSIKTTDENAVFPSDISSTSTQLLSYKEYQYKIDKLLNGTVVTTYTDADRPKIVTAINPYITTSKDFQKDIKTVHTVVNYNNLYLPTKSTTDINDGFAITTSELAYNPPNTTTGANYSIGIPLWKTEAIEAYGDTKAAKEEYEYSGSLLTKKKTYNRDNSEYIEEVYDYDDFGNVIQKTVNNPFNNDQVQSTVTKSQYDDKGRFVIKKTDNLNLETLLTYNDLGQLLTQTDPLNNKLTNTYDGWGKLLTSKSNLAGTTTYTYQRFSNGDSKIVEYSPDGDQKISYKNKLGQIYKSSVKSFGQGTYVSSVVGYDDIGRKIQESEPYFDDFDSNSPSVWNITEYDDYSRPIKFTAFTGKIIESSYSGNTVTATETNANNRFKTQVFDALGNLSSVTDLGGTITYKYNAAGENIEAKYGTNIVTTKYDNWGRKSELNDPSNGTYKYEYNGYAQITHTISPKGHKYYQYNAFGQLYNQVEISNDNTSTNKNITFNYNAEGQVIKKSGTSKGEFYQSSVSYDANGRIISSEENSNGKNYYRKNIAYDDKGRIISYEKGLISSGITTKVNLESVHNTWNGELSQLKDKTSGKILWELTDTNAKGQVLKEKLGGTTIDNTYDTNNFLSNIIHKNTANNNTVLSVVYSFNAVKNELNSRTNGGNLNIVESFTYDTNNRLTSWTNPKTGQQSTNTYDAQGRIKENDQIGTIKFDDPIKIYRPTGATLNTAGEQNYTNDLIQRISYNENNDPVFIDGEKGDVEFSYGLTAMRQRVTYGGNFGEGNVGKFTKYYSEDGSYEITLDNSTGKEKHVLYIGGTPYESNILYLKNFTESSGSYKFLHKDYLGSILAITNEGGDLIEQRHFDAWGNITLFRINGIDQDLSKFSELSLLDRGYTSHEHFSEVGIIHMNGRLYDPLLRRFLNADEFIQDPHNTQNYNKYGYVMNNPLLYNDPSGEVMGWDDALIAIGIAVFTSVATDYYLNRPVNLGNMFQSVIMSLASAGIADGIGTVFKVAEGASKSTTFWMGVGRAGAHAISQGALSYVKGGNFWSGALAGAFASASNDLLGGWLKNKPNNKFLNSRGFSLMTGAVSGGVGSVLGGGNFWQGAAQGLIVTLFNFLAHKVEDPTQKTYTINGKTYDYKGLQEYYATVIGESSNNVSEAQGIGEVILNRLDHKGADLTGGFIEKVGGADQYDAIGGSIYNDVMGMKFFDLLNMKSDNIYYSRFAGASKALSNWWHLRPGITNGAYIWNATWQKNKSDIGFNWRAYNRGVYTITAEIGQTTFFKYKDSNKKWP